MKEELKLEKRVRKNSLGKYLNFSLQLSEVDNVVTNYINNQPKINERTAKKANESLFNGKKIDDISIDNLLVLDIETLGFNKNKPLFLIGTCKYKKGYDIELYLARDFSEEKVILKQFWNEASKYEYIISYNGQRFDLPFLRDRAISNRVGISTIDESKHLDLLPVTRKSFVKYLLPFATQRTLEKNILGFERKDDVRGREIINAYREFVYNQNEAVIKPVIYHNILDLVGLMGIFTFLYNNEKESLKF